MDNAPSIIFPHLGIRIGYFPTGFQIGTFRIAFYGIIIAIAMVVAVLVILRIAKKTNQSTDNYIDLAIITIICGIIGARIYYVLFSLDYYIANPDQILNLRGGGIAIYGGLIGAFIAGYIVCRYKKLIFTRLMDTALPGVLLAQAIGRWANFVNREAFGEYTDSLFAMQIRFSEVNADAVTDLMRENMVLQDGVNYVQVSPTFLYESVWCLVLFILIMIFRKYQKYNGEVGLWYLGGYALGRAWIEGLRTDALMIGNTGIAVSQILSIAVFAGAFAILLINRIRLARKSWEPEFYLVLPEGYPGTVEYSEKVKKERKEKRAAKYKETHGEEKKDASEWERYTVKKQDEAEAAESTEPTESTEITEAAESTESTESAESTEVAEPAESTVTTDSTANSETADQAEE